VPKVACFAVAGIRLWFNSNDHMPPHFHAEKVREWQVRVYFIEGARQMIEVVYSTRPNRPRKPDLKAIVKKTQAHRHELYQQWQAVVDVKTPGPER
jgi:hypothetical protein